MHKTYTSVGGRVPGCPVNFYQAYGLLSLWSASANVKWTGYLTVKSAAFVSAAFVAMLTSIGENSQTDITSLLSPLAACGVA